MLTTGTGSEQRTGVYVRDGSGNFIFFNDYVAHDGRNYGWRYNKSVGDDDDDPSGAGINIPAFDGGKFDDRGAHRMKILANGETVKLYLDDVFGVEIPFAATVASASVSALTVMKLVMLPLGILITPWSREGPSPLWLKGISTATRCRMATSSSNIPAH